MKSLRIACALSVIITLCGCIRIEVIDENRPSLLRQPVDTNAVAVGLSMKLKLLFGSVRIEGAYLVRLDDKEDTLKQDRLILADTLSNGYVYLLNAQPGRYAVVAVMYPYRFSKQVIYLMPKSLVQQTVTTVAPGTIGYLGDYEVEGSGIGSEGGDDDIEKHYFHLLSAKPVANPPKFVAHPLNSARDEQSEKQFLKYTDEMLLKGHGGGWSTWIQQQLQIQH